MTIFSNHVLTNSTMVKEKVFFGLDSKRLFNVLVFALVGGVKGRAAAPLEPELAINIAAAQGL